MLTAQRLQAAAQHLALEVRSGAHAAMCSRQPLDEPLIINPVAVASAARPSWASDVGMQHTKPLQAAALQRPASQATSAANLQRGQLTTPAILHGAVQHSPAAHSISWWVLMHAGVQLHM